MENIGIKCSPNLVFKDYAELGVYTSKLIYHGRGEPVYADGRQVMVRTCNDFLISCHDNNNGKRGILLTTRKQEPAMGEPWPFGGELLRGFTTPKSIAEKIKSESGLKINLKSIELLVIGNFMWKETPNKNAKEKGLPLGIHDFGLLFYVEGYGKLALDKFSEKPLIVTPKMYVPSFRENLHDYVRIGMDQAILLSKNEKL